MQQPASFDEFRTMLSKNTMSNDDIVRMAASLALAAANDASLRFQAQQIIGGR